MSKKKDRNLIWIDLEMTGLNPLCDRIIEIATLITDSNLNILAEGPEIVIYQPETILQLMNSWNIRVHTDNGLIEQIKKSTFDEKKASNLTLKFIQEWVPNIGKSPMCGNSISQDRKFLFHYMPDLESYFHYRILDVSTLQELVFRWKPQILSNFKKINNHRAMNDIRESVAELAFYKKHFINL